MSSTLPYLLYVRIKRKIQNQFVQILIPNQNPRSLFIVILVLRIVSAGLIFSHSLLAQHFSVPPVPRHTFRTMPNNPSFADNRSCFAYRNDKVSRCLSKPPCVYYLRRHNEISFPMTDDRQLRHFVRGGGASLSDGPDVIRFCLSLSQEWPNSPSTLLPETRRRSMPTPPPPEGRRGRSRHCALMTTIVIVLF